MVDWFSRRFIVTSSETLSSTSIFLTLHLKDIEVLDAGVRCALGCAGEQTQQELCCGDESAALELPVVARGDGS